MKAVLFDLDGTLADTALDLGAALNRLRQEHDLAPLADELIRPQASHGARGLIGLGFGLTPEDAGFEPLRQRFLDYYAQDLATRTVWFDGVAELLLALEQRGVHWGIVTNKPSRFTQPLLLQLPPASHPGVVVSGDTVGVPKPDPRPMRHAADILGVAPADCIYVGDAERDIEAGRAVGMTTLIAYWGYLGPADQPEQWGADGGIHHPLEVLNWLPGSR
jgi:N-acetyl-D-muramate 6-phosphate phosphatase